MFPKTGLRGRSPALGRPPGVPILDRDDPINAALRGLWLPDRLTSHDIAGPNAPLILANSTPINSSALGLAPSFTPASTQYGRSATAAATAYPLTLSCWVKLSTTSSNNNDDFVAISIVDETSLNEFWLSFFHEPSGPQTSLRAVAQGGGGISELLGVLTYTLNWRHIAGVFTSASNLTVYIDGVDTNGSLRTNTGAPSGIAQTYISGFFYNTSNFYGGFPGLVTNARVFSRALQASEVARLYADPCAGLIFPQDLMLDLGAGSFGGNTLMGAMVM